MRLRHFCTVPGCPRSAHGDGLCACHYQRWVLAGRPDRAEWIDAGAVKPGEWKRKGNEVKANG